MSIADETKEALKAAKELDGVFGSMRENIQANARELGAFKTPAKDAKALYSQLDNELKKLQNQEEGLSRLTDKQLQATRAKTQEIVREIGLKAQDLVIKRGLDQLDGEQLRKAAQKLEASGKITEAESALLAAKADGFAIEKETLDLIDQEAGFREKSNANLGVAGNLLKGVKSLGSFADAFKLDEVAKAMEEAADEASRVGDGLARGTVLAAGLKSAAGGLVKTLSDPSVIIGGLLSGFKEVDKANVDFQRQTGQSLNTFETSMNVAGNSVITLSDYIKTASELTAELGQNAAAVFTPEDITEASEMAAALGMSSSESAKLLSISNANGTSLKSNNEAIVEGVNSFNKQNNAAVGAGSVLKAVANTSEGIAISYAGMPGKLASAAAAAMKLGMTLGDLDKISSSLLDFQGSIEKEMEAELLTGKQLNLEAARQLALNNDLEGVAKELTKQGITSASFSKLNRIQQEAQAAALGMSKDEMAKMLLQQQIGNDLSGEGLNDMQKQTLEQIKSQEAAVKFTKAIDQLKQAFAPILGIFAQILSSKAGLAAIKVIILAIVGAKAVTGAAQMASSFSGMGKTFKNLKSGASGLAGSLKDAYKQGGLLGKTFKGGQFMPGGGRAAAGGQKGGGILGSIKGAAKGLLGGPADDAGKAADSTKGIKADQGEGVKGFLKGLGDGLASIGKKAKDVIKGGLALGIVSIILAGSFALALMMVKDVDPAQMIAFSAAIGILGLSVALMGKMGGSVIQGALALGIVAIALIPAAFAFSLLAGVDIGTIIAFSIALPLLALAAAGLGFIAPFIIAGSVALAILGLALIPAAMGFSLISGLNMESILSFTMGVGLLAAATAGLGFMAPFIIMGSVALGILGLALIPAAEGFNRIAGLDMESVLSFTKGVGLLASTTAGLGIMAPFIMVGSAALAILGLALIPLSMGFQAMSDANTETLVASLAQFASLAPGLGLVAASLFAISGGLGAMAIAGIAALPVMGALTGLAMVSTGISSILGGGDEEESKGPSTSSDITLLAEKLDQMNLTLNALLVKEGTVTLDGSKVGTALTVGSYKLQ